MKKVYPLLLFLNTCVKTLEINPGALEVDGFVMSQRALKSLSITRQLTQCVVRLRLVLVLSCYFSVLF